MNWRPILALLTLLVTYPAFANTDVLGPGAYSQVCRHAIAAAERAHGIPAHLLAAVATVESGRRDQASGTFNPWPWTTNFDGQGSFYDNEIQAVAAAIAMRPRATKSVDVGCMQISLTHHPDAFPNMDTAFDPTSNADYGARLLLRLFQKTGSWAKAVGMYHSATPDLAEDYQRKVYAAWPEEQRLAEAADPTALAPTALAPTALVPTALAPTALANAWAATTVKRSLMTEAIRPPMGRIIPLATGLGGVTTPGRSLASYRAAPVRIAAYH